MLHNAISVKLKKIKTKTHNVIVNKIYCHCHVNDKKWSRSPYIIPIKVIIPGFGGENLCIMYMR